ncbi:MAG: biotin--[acetyl-CoA-carboxylase] ligase [Candidatus Cryptobacteroides sp.]
MSQITWHKSLKSTNTELREHISEYDSLSVVATVEQSAGRGQGDHSWYASPGKNLTFSIVFKPDYLNASDALYLSRITTLALLSYLKGKGVEARIKWPNDIWIGEKKICGILIENILDGQKVESSIIGIGLNLNEENWPEELPNPVSLHELTGEHYDIKEELAVFHKEFCRHAEMLKSEDGKNYLCKAFKAKVFRLPEGLEL